MKKINTVTVKGINYIDEHGMEKYIDFKECYDNWLQYKKRMGELTDKDMVNLENSNKHIGQRDICANPCYIEFFTKPFTRFEFKEIKGNVDAKIAFSNIHREILSHGWTTIDLS